MEEDYETIINGVFVFGVVGRMFICIKERSESATRKLSRRINDYCYRSEWQRGKLGWDC